MWRLDWELDLEGIVRIAVVGAGFGGLMAARRLVEGGHDVVVLEARDRVGGRVWSDSLSTPTGEFVIERGGEFVLDDYDVMRALAAELGLQIADMGMSYYWREVRGGQPTSEEAIAACVELVTEAAQGLPRQTSVAELFSRLRLSGSVDEAALAAYASRIEATDGFPLDQTSVSVVADGAEPYTPRRSHRVAGGNQLIADRMAAELGSRLSLAAPVEAVAWGDDGVRLKTSTGEVFADAAVIAVPLAIVRALPFDPPLPEWKTSAWARSGLGQAAKLHVPLREPAAPGAVHDVPHRYWTWTARDASGSVAPVVHCFAGSPFRLTKLGASDGPAQWAERVAALRPELALDAEAAVVTSWPDDPWAREAYTADSIAAHDGDTDVMPRAVGPLHFAGEHTADSWSGRMEGALRSGVRAAAEFPSESSTG